MRRQSRALFLERLEERSLLATLIWTGLDVAANNRWSNPKNWQGEYAPQQDDSLVFPAGPTGTQLSSVNDYVAGSRSRFRARTTRCRS
jgi:hypothetical protein